MLDSASKILNNLTTITFINYAIQSKSKQHSKFLKNTENMQMAFIFKMPIVISIGIIELII